MAEPIDDHPGYVASVFKLLRANDNRPNKIKPMADAKLEDLKVEGESATAVMSGTFLKPRKGEEPITFRRVGLDWKIEQLGNFGTRITVTSSSPVQQAIQPENKPKKFDRDGLAAIHRAARAGKLAALQVLLAQGADVNLQQRNLRGTALHYAVEAGHSDIIRELLKHQAETEARDARGYTPLMRAAKKGSTEVVNILLEAGANINAKPEVGEWSALCLAIHGKHQETVQLLVDRKAKFPAHESFARSMRRSATQLGVRLPGSQLPAAKPPVKMTRPKPKKIVLPVLPEVSELEPIDRPDEKGFSKLHRAVLARGVEATQALIDQGADVDVRQRTYHGTPLQYAASAGRLDVVLLLIKHKTTVDAVDLSGRTPLMWAAWKGRTDVVEALLDAGADIHRVSYKKWSALHFAADKGQFEAAQLLIDRGASLSAKTADGETPIDMNPNISPSG